MDRTQVLKNVNFVVIDLERRGKLIWDGVFHGETDPAGPIGPRRDLDVSNGF